MLVLSLIGIAVISACDQEGAWDQRIDAAFDPSACPAAPEVILDESDYSGPLIDTHFHIPHLPDSPPGLIERDYSEVITQIPHLTWLGAAWCAFRGCPDVDQG